MDLCNVVNLYLVHLVTVFEYSNTVINVVYTNIFAAKERLDDLMLIMMMVMSMGLMMVMKTIGFTMKELQGW